MFVIRRAHISLFVSRRAVSLILGFRHVIPSTRYDDISSYIDSGYGSCEATSLADEDMDDRTSIVSGSEDLESHSGTSIAHEDQLEYEADKKAFVKKYINGKLDLEDFANFYETPLNF